MRILATLALVLSLTTGVLPADGLGSVPVHAYVVDGRIDPGRLAEWAAAVAVLIRAHDGHPGGAEWATYRELSGGPEVRFRVFQGLDRIGELDGRVSNRRILVDALGAVEGARVHEALRSGVESSDRLTSLVGELSRPWPEDGVPDFLWVATVRVAEGKMTEYAALQKRVRLAYDQAGAPVYWLCYADSIGGDRTELVYYFRFDAFAEIDAWPSRRDVLAGALGAREGGRLASAVEAVSDTVTGLWKLEPELSRLGGSGPEDEE